MCVGYGMFRSDEKYDDPLALIQSNLNRKQESFHKEALKPLNQFN